MPDKTLMPDKTKPIQGFDDEAAKPITRIIYLLLFVD